ncbi:MAG: M20/M25/M40 family metallo-hydrolase [Pyrinomonadaceae bacterium]|nr:M20/M25/M40 family metallo-hydrolase [Pyrinomonadaceae bacterium]
MQSFPYVSGVELGGTNAMTLSRRAPAVEGEPLGGGITTLDLRLNEDWMPLGFSTDARLYTLPVTFVGYGLTASDLKHDDYAGADVKGRVALALAGTPDGDNPHGQFGRYTDVRWKAVAARDHGAKALVVVASDANFRNDKLARLSYDNSASDAGLPVIVISRQVAAQALGLGGITQLAELEKRVASAAAIKKDAAPQTVDPVTDAVNKASFLENSRLTIATSIKRRDAPASNVIGILEGSDPKLKKEAIVIGAHYDHLGRGGSGSLAPREGEIHHGADDNASGVAGVLELARIFAAERGKIKRTIVFIAFGGEEEGLLGSNYYVNHPVVPLADTVAMINMDMIGRLKDEKLNIGGVGTSSQWREWVAKAHEANLSKRFSLTLNEDGFGPSDHSSFYGKKVPVLFFWTGTHADYHKPSDTAEKINYEGEARILSLVMELVQAIDGSAQRPTYTAAKSESTGRTMGFSVSLGTIPNYAESNDGLKLDGVRDNSPAAKAGLKGGDVIVKLAGRDIRNVYDYTYALGQMKAGEEYEVEAMRGSERVKMKIIPDARK